MNPYLNCELLPEFGFLKRLVLSAFPDPAPTPSPALSCLCPPTNCLAVSLCTHVGPMSPSTGIATRTDLGTSSQFPLPFRTAGGRILGGGAHSPDWAPKAQSGLQQAFLHGKPAFLPAQK